MSSCSKQRICAELILYKLDWKWVNSAPNHHIMTMKFARKSQGNLNNILTTNLYKRKTLLSVSSREPDISPLYAYTYIWNLKNITITTRASPILYVSIYMYIYTSQHQIISKKDNLNRRQILLLS